MSLDSLYPFLYSGDSGTATDVLEEVCRSTETKVRETAELRALVLEREGRRLLECADRMAERFAAGGRLLAFGNGGSSTDAQDLASLFLGSGRGALCLTNDIASVTALSNDVGFDVVFSRQVAAFGRPRDIAVGLSTSGNSANLLRAFDEAARRGLLTVGLAGYDGGRMAEIDTLDYLFTVPSLSVHRIQEAQTTLYHALWELTMDRAR
ncbi:D-sedoheptulose-7-phosphate isomerase [Planobispora takensis]|uniref:Phosphoheptose isomerase n=1 Tax=Planobispora takensis TaxID=1367882 RepID=A0A8J3SVJ5_9ACTN|nr:SIS domain-containing protein [Planobispora takensis]GII00140.1 phosphoheptose isomerase [Planobispora takensis]